MLSHALACLLLLLCVQIITTEAQSYISWCYPDYGNYTQGSPFQSNLNTVLNSLASNTRLNDFYNTSSGNGMDQAYGLIYCRGDVSEEDCRTCQTESAKKIVEFCPNSKRALHIYDYCWISYCADLFNSSQTVRYYVEDSATRNTVSFMDEVYDLLNDLVKRASFATSRLALGRSNHTYGLVQCARQLSPDGCVACLQPMIDYIIQPPIIMMTNYRALAPTCFLRYEFYRFFRSSLPPLATANSPPPATANSPPPPVPTPGSPSKVF